MINTNGFNQLAGAREFAESVKHSTSVLEHNTEARDDFFAFIEPDILAFHTRIQYVQLFVWHAPGQLSSAGCCNCPRTRYTP